MADDTASPVALDGTTKPPAAPFISYTVSTRTFRFLWWLFLFIYLCVGLQLLLLAGFYFMLMGYPSVSYYLDMFRLISLDLFPLVFAVYLVSGLFIYRDIYLLLQFSWQHRRLCLVHETRVANAPPRAPPTTLPQKIWAGYLALFSVRSEYFDVVMLTRELVEILVQISQAYTSSCYTPNVWLNFAFGALIAVNCISSPIAERVTGADVGQLRTVVLLIDLALDLVWLALPLSLLPHYIRGFFGGDAVMYEDTFMVRAFMESQLMMVTSVPDLFTKVLPSLSIFFTIRKLRLLLRRDTSSSSSYAAAYVEPAAAGRLVVPVSALDHVKKTTGGSDTTDGSTSTTTAAAARRHTRHTTSRSRSVKLVHWVDYLLLRVLLLLGAFTIAMYALVAALRPTCEPGCKLVVHPWFDYDKCRCVVQEIDCHARGIRGAAAELQHALAGLEPLGLQSLIVSHCPQLEMPPAIRGFFDLYGLEIYNSTIAAWPATASLTAAAFNRLGFVYLVRTHAASIPDGLLQGDLPPTLLEIDIIVSELTTLPDDLDAKWPHVRTVYLDHGRFTHVPNVLGRMPLQSLTLYNNSISSVANDTFAATTALNYLVLSGNPLTLLPTALGDTASLFELQLQDTRVAAPLPDVWSDGSTPAATLRVFARGAPVCAGQDASDSAMAIPTTRSFTATLHSGGFAVSCGVRGSLYRGIRSKSYYALEGKSLDRAIV